MYLEGLEIDPCFIITTDFEHHFLNQENLIYPSVHLSAFFRSVQLTNCNLWDIWFSGPKVNAVESALDRIIGSTTRYIGWYRVCNGGPCSSTCFNFTLFNIHTIRSAQFSIEDRLRLGVPMSISYLRYKYIGSY